LPDHYIAFIGNTDPRKNVTGAMLAYAEYLKQSDKKRQLVMLHNNPETFETSLRKLHLKHLNEHIKMLGYIESTDMSAFYSLADMFIYPSQREGFGMPVLEAMACGTPVITSNVSSMPEVGGDAALYASPDKYMEITAQMLNLETHPELREKMMKAGFEQCKKFTWDNAAQKVLNVYQKVYGQVKHL
jgi:glycosyltransferase involved in cell wall biosynthesis